MTTDIQKPKWSKRKSLMVPLNLRAMMRGRCLLFTFVSLVLLFTTTTKRSRVMSKKKKKIDEDQRIWAALNKLAKPDEPPLVKGGQGRRSDCVIGSTVLLTWLLVAALSWAVFIAIAALFGVFS